MVKNERDVSEGIVLLPDTLFRQVGVEQLRIPLAAVELLRQNQISCFDCDHFFAELAALKKSGIWQAYASHATAHPLSTTRSSAGASSRVFRLRSSTEDLAIKLVKGLQYKSAEVSDFIEEVAGQDDMLRRVLRWALVGKNHMHAEFLRSIYKNVLASVLAHAMYPENIDMPDFVLVQNNTIVGYSLDWHEGEWRPTLHNSQPLSPSSNATFRDLKLNLVRAGFYFDQDGTNCVIDQTGTVKVVDLSIDLTQHVQY